MQTFETTGSIDSVIDVKVRIYYHFTSYTHTYHHSQMVTALEAVLLADVASHDQSDVGVYSRFYFACVSCLNYMPRLTLHPASPSRQFQ